jgi:hypothetical protein
LPDFDSKRNGQFRDAKGVATRLASNAPKNTAANEGERSERQNAVNNQSRRDRHVVTPEVVYLGYVLGERQVRLL